LPQVYLHFDPLTRAQRRAFGKPDYLSRERMDFLLLLPNGVRIVIEVDGKQHYADGDAASPPRYADMVAEDRALRLIGYEVFRFGGYELRQPDAATVLRRFFDDLFAVHGISES
jgi:very-short-patch-repair endonuclease